MSGGKFNQATDKKEQKMGADEMLKMIKHGYQDIIHTCDGEDEDMAANIDSILKKSEEKTEEINNKLKAVTIENHFNIDSMSLIGDNEGAKTSIIYDGEAVPPKQLAKKMQENHELLEA